MRRHLLALLALLAPFAPGAHLRAAPEPPPALTRSPADRLDEVAEAITSLRLDRAEQLLAALPSGDAERPAALYQQARLLFHRGLYADAVAVGERAVQGESGRQRERYAELLELMRASQQVTADYTRLASDDGRYVVLHPPGKDEVLAPYALEVLRSADQALTDVFGVKLPGPLRLEIYPGPEVLARVSTLTVEQIETTGTVALSKWHRLMVTSPKALVRGYPWADTVTHELVHMMLSYVSGERAPVWLQEGTAKLFERAWRTQGAGLLLDPASRQMLGEAARDGKLLTFEQMHPSIAMLPSEDDAALAFAQVSTFMEQYVERHGQQALRDAFARIEAGVDARDALAEAAGEPFARMEREWKATLPKIEGGDLHRLKRRFKVGEGPADESEEVEESEARRFMRLGDLLWDRGRIGAAAREYEKASSADPLDPIVAARWGRAALQAGDPAGAIRALSPQQERYPGHAPTHAVLGAAYVELGRLTEARAPLREAIWINPFDPAPHCGLARATDDPSERQREAQACQRLRRR
jgi:tetratricopeptide (TPR) repeat protein